MDISTSLARARGGAHFHTTPELMAPDPQSPWGKRMRVVWSLLPQIRIQMPEGLTLGRWWGIGPVGPLARWRVVRLWPRVFQDRDNPAAAVVLPERIRSGLLDTIPAPVALRMRICWDRSWRYYIFADSGGKAAIYARRFVNWTNRHAYHDFLRVSDSVPGSIGTRILVNAVLIYRDIGIQSIGMLAGLSSGGAVWPKMGFHPVNTAEWRSTHARIRANLALLPADLLASYAGKYGHSLADEVEAVLALDAPESIWAIADIDKDKALEVPGYRFGVAGFLLQGTRWKGILKLGNGDSYERLKVYAAKKFQANLL